MKIGLFRAFQYRNFRLFFAGQSISLIGTWIQQIAMSWLVYRLTSSALWLGIITFAAQIPAFILSPVAGLAADRHDRRKVVIATQSLAMLQALTLAVLTYLDLVTPTLLVLISCFLGSVTAFDIPARQSFLIELVERKENLGNAIALNSLMFNAARLLGPAIAGIVIAYVGETTCFFINAASFFAVIVSLLLIKVRESRSLPTEFAAWERLREGFGYAFGSYPIRTLLLVLAVLNLLGASYVVLLPVFAKEILNGDARTFGFLSAAAGIGALTATVILAQRPSVLGLGRLLAKSAVGFSIGIIAFSFTKQFAASVLVLALLAYCLMTCMSCCNIIIQTIVDDDKRGRVMSLYTMAFLGTTPIGSLLIGDLAHRIGTPVALAFAGVCCLLASVLFAVNLSSFRTALHSVYVELGVIGEQLGS